MGRYIKEQKDLKGRYKDICMEYIVKFVDKHEYEFTGWVSDEVGGLATFIEQYFFNFDQILEDINNNYPVNMIFEWQDAIVGSPLTKINLRTFVSIGGLVEIFINPLLEYEVITDELSNFTKGDILRFKYEDGNYVPISDYIYTLDHNIVNECPHFFNPISTSLPPINPTEAFDIDNHQDDVGF